MIREFRDDILWCYRSDCKKFKETIIAFALTCLAMLALTVILMVHAG